MRQINSQKRAAARAIFTSLSAALLSACGGSQDTTSAPAQSAAAGGTATVTIQASPVSAGALPSFHAAALLLETPSDIDALEPSASAHLAPHSQRSPSELAMLSTRRLSRQMIESALNNGVPRENDVSNEVTQGLPAATTAPTVYSYTPAQIRAAYNLAPLPAPGTTLTSAQAAGLGAGQTIYLIDAYADPAPGAELTAFSTKFGLPHCSTSSPLATNTALPLAPASLTAGCTFSLVYAASTGGITATAPSIDVGSNWAIEQALDIEVSHAIAPLARIILIEAVDATNQSLASAISLANSMGPGIVSMSFAEVENFGVTAQYDSVFSAPNMTYLAASGDWGTQVNWPAVSSKVIAVGGTSLKYDGVNPRTETIWSQTGGGVSLVTPLPAYQNSTVAGMFNASGRITNDVSFNADPNTGVYIDYYYAASATGGNWLSVGGTSASTPQWAGLLAIANAERAAKQLLPLGDAHVAIYALDQSASIYKGDIFDITTGSISGCTAVVCVTGVGFDGPSGLGTPNATNVLATLVGNPIGAAPVVTGATVKGTTGVALTFQTSVSDKDALVQTLIGAPAGMTISNTGLVSWAAPLMGTYTFTVQAVDATNGLYGTGTYTLAVVGPQVPRVASVSLPGVAATILNYSVVAMLDTNPVTYTVSGAPSGLTISSAGAVSWINPVQGVYPVTVTAFDAKTGLSGSGVLTITVSAAKPPTLSSRSATYLAGSAVSLGMAASYPSNHSVVFTMSGAPSGVTIAAATGTVSITNPAIGTYKLTVTITDTTVGLSASAPVAISVISPNPTIAAGPITGVAGNAVSGLIQVNDPGSLTSTLTVSGVPSGMVFTNRAAGGASVAWSKPVTGTYNLGLKVVDTAGFSATSTMTVTITAH